MKKYLSINLLCILVLLNLSCSIQAKPKKINKLKNKADSKKFDKMIGEFMQKYSLPGLSVAFAKDGKILFASGYGFADKQLKETVNIKHRFRIASISKPITSVAILKLIEQNKLALNDKVFGKDGIFKGKYLKKPDTNIEAIEIRHLLQHTAAPEWSNQGNRTDPMFVHYELSQHELIQKTFEERVVKNKPGSEYAYSNFGYMVLGRVIEKVSGKDYETFVNNLVSKHGIKSFEIAGDGGTPRAKNETAYYNGHPPTLYNFPNDFPTSRMDAHGGWIATAVDLVKFGQLVDNIKKPKNILSSKSIKIMKTTNDVSKEYGFGWQVDKDKNFSHSGSLPGTASTLTITNDGMTWAILTNSRSDEDGFYDELEGLMWKIIKEIKLK